MLLNAKAQAREESEEVAGFNGDRRLLFCGSVGVVDVVGECGRELQDGDDACRH